MAHGAEGLERAREESRWIGQEVLDGSYGTEFVQSLLRLQPKQSRELRGTLFITIHQTVYYCLPL